MPPDPRPPRRVADLHLLKELHVRWRGDCVIADETCVTTRYSLHHIHKHPRDDLEPNLVMLCGHGTIGHHGYIEAHRADHCARLAVYLIAERPDTMDYLAKKLGSEEARDQWLRSQLHYAPSDADA